MKFLFSEIVEAFPMTRGDYNRHRGWIIPLDENPLDNGFLLTRINGRETWCPHDTFIQHSERIEEE